MLPLSVAMVGGRLCMIRWGVRPGIVVSLEHHAKAQRSDGELVVSIMPGG
jgi:hypothetical protein